VKETEDEGGIEVEKTVAKIDEVYLEGNDFFQKISKDKEQMGILQVLMIQNPSPKALAKFPPRKIKEVYKLLPELSLEKDKEIVKDLSNLRDFLLALIKNLDYKLGDPFIEAAEEKDLKRKKNKAKMNVERIFKTLKAKERGEINELYSGWYDYIKKKKPNWLNVTFASDQVSPTTEQLIKILKPYLIEKFIRRKQYEKTN
jgi:hypothetical protein